ncbi:MAG: WYL domain-containing protein [Clostridiales bacterium]|nr:WYL domain-containing protein [Clostridiales bacterium]
MANCDLSKIKLLYLYDFFMTRLNPFDDSSVSLAELLDILEKETGYRFERKSVYADIDKLNDFMRTSGKLRKGADEWIFKDRKRYKVNQLNSQITIDEAKLLVDAVNTTAFTDSGISDKIMDMFPSYFRNTDDNVALVPRDHKPSAKLTGILNTLRSSIREKSVLTIFYGYKLSNAPAFRDERKVSPLALDWTNNTYYLIAVDNDIYDRLEDEGKPREPSIRKFRIDRIDAVRYENKEKFRGFANASERRRAVENVYKNSISAFSSEDIMSVEINLSFDPSAPDAGSNPKKEVLKAYNILADHMQIKRIVSDAKLLEGSITIVVEAADVPTFYAFLFQAGTVPGISVRISNSEVRDKYAAYLTNAMDALR